MFRYIRHLCLVFLSVHALGDSSSLNDKRNIGLDACRAAFTRYLWNLVVTYGPLLGYIAYITSNNSCFSSFSPTHMLSCYGSDRGSYSNLSRLVPRKQLFTRLRYVNFFLVDVWAISITQKENRRWTYGDSRRIPQVGEREAGGKKC